MNTASEIVSIPLNKLVASRLNVRKIGGHSIEDLAASIKAHGLIHNLVVTKAAKGDKHEVVAGARRLAALNKLAKEKVVAKTLDVPCRIVDADISTESSLAENTIRQAMHPADQFMAFQQLVSDGLGVEEIAARFGVTSTTVRQRLKLANVAPRLFELYRTGEINLDQLMALAVTDDHAAQERIWDSAQEWQRQPHALRRALTETMVDAANDPRARFVGVEAYLNAGGLLERDLFQPEHEGYLTDAAKLERLTVEKLEALAAEVRREGWKWVDIQPIAEYPDLTKFDRLRTVYVPMSEETRLEIEALQTEQERIEGAYPDAEEYPPDVDQRMAEIESRIEELNDQPRKYRAQEIPLAGAIVSLENHGQAVIYRGLVRTEDKKRVKQVAKSPSDGQHEEESDQGGCDRSDASALSAALVEDLTAHRTAALRAVLATRPDVALVAVAHSLALRVCYPMEMTYEVGSALSLSSEKGGCSLESHAKNIETSLAYSRLDEIHNQWLKRIPEDPAEFWQWLLDQEQAVVLDLLAFCVGQTVHAVQLHSDGQQPRFIFAAAQLAQAVNLDMADWWAPTKESYLGRVKKDQILEAIEEGTSETNFEDLRKLKKGELVAAAERRLTGGRWLPQILKP
jgi:ParB family transcriptional regulator, chromosome partitioning protein